MDLKKDICLVCLSTFNTCSNTKTRESSRQKEHVPLFTNFLKFAQNYLKISTEATNQLLITSGSKNEREAFCERCQVEVIHPICQVYLELLSTRLRLSAHLTQLGKLLNNSTENPVSQRSLAKQLGVKNVSDLTEIRELLKQKCEQNRKEFSPIIVVSPNENKTNVLETSEKKVSPERAPLELPKAAVKQESINQDDGADIDDDDDEGDRYSFAHEPDQDSDIDWCPPTSPPDPPEPLNKEFREIKVVLKRKMKEDAKIERKNKVNAKGDAEGLQNEEISPTIQCCFCWKSFTDESSLKSHVHSSHSKRKGANYGKFHCEVENCQEKFDSCSEFNTHLETHSLEEAIQLCSVCGLGFVEKKVLKLHELVHIKPVKVAGLHGKLLYCPEQDCNQGFRSISKLQTHFNVRHGLVLKRFKCPEEGCFHVATSSLAILQHQKSFHDPEGLRKKMEVGSHPCSKCGKIFVTRRKMRAHELLVHGEKRHKCSACEKVFSCRDKLRKHFFTIHDRNPAICPHCGKTYPTSIHLSSHMARTHPETGPEPSIQCPHCPKKLRLKYLLGRHILKVHPDAPENLKCSFCDLRMEGRRKTNMEEHELTHIPREERREWGVTHICHICGKEFLCKETCNRHIKTHRPVVKQE